MPDKYIKKILDCRIYDIVVETPIQHMRFLSKDFCNDILIKREDLQPVFSFKIRGAYNKMQHLSRTLLKKGVLAASAGNHAQGVALAARKMGVRAVIVMPVTTPQIKVASVSELGAEVILHGDRFDESLGFAMAMQKKQELTFVHPYDDEDVIAGQGTIGMEIVRQYPGRIDAIFIPVGGGGLIAGISAFIKYIRPGTKIIGVECNDSACLSAALKAGKRVILKKLGNFADGTAVAQIGKEPFRVARKCVDEVVTVTPDEICGAIRDVFQDTRSIAETAGALSVAGVKKYIQQHKISGKTLLTIDSGANVNFDRLRYISERADIGEKKEILFSVRLPERPGTLRDFLKVISKHDITEFNYRFDDAANAVFLIGIYLMEGEKERISIMRKMAQAGYKCIDMTGSELVKMHISHMIGGKTQLVTKEVLYQIQLPERPGILAALLNKIQYDWNITLFHYRKHGWIYGDVLIAFDISKGGKKELEDRMRSVKCDFTERTNEQAYKMFLKKEVRIQ